MGQFNLVGIPPAPRGVPQIEVTFDIDADGIVNVGAKDKATNKDQSSLFNFNTVTIAASSGLSDKEIENMINEAEKHAEEDKARKDSIEAKNDAEGTISNIEKNMNDFKDQVDKEEEGKIREKITELREMLTKETVDASEVKTKVGELQTESLGLFEKVYRKKQNENSSGETVDAKSEEVKEEKKN